MTAVIGPYRVVRTLGAGGWSTVYEVSDPGGRRWALKRLRDDLGAEALARFQREVASLGRIDHPGVVRLVDAGVDGAAPYLVTPVLDGATVRTALGDGALVPEAAVALVIAAAQAVAAIHAAGLVHRDLKPENLVLTDDGAVVVIDLGLALGAEHSRHTAEDALTGSVPYMAPEQIEDGEPSPASDVWALGVVLFEAATGALPFVGWDDGRCPPLVDAPAHCGPEVSASFDAIVQRCLARGPGQRFASMAALATALREEAEVAERVTEDAGPVARAAAPVVAGPTTALDDATIVDGPIAPAAPRPSRAGRWGVVVGVAIALPLGVGALAAPHCQDDAPWQPLMSEARWRLRAATPPPPVEAPPVAPLPAEAVPPPPAEALPAAIDEAAIELHPEPPSGDRPARPATRPSRRDRPRPTTRSGEGLD